jgi:ribose 5-phosphate isomerase A
MTASHSVESCVWLKCAWGKYSASRARNDPCEGRIRDAPWGPYRRAWLEAVAAWIDGQRAKGRPAVITCSALKRSYYDMIIGDRPEVRLVYLCGSRTLIAGRLAGRQDHFLPASLLPSQIDTLEEPGPDEDPLIIDIGPPAGQLANEIIRLLGASVAFV